MRPVTILATMQFDPWVKSAYKSREVNLQSKADVSILALTTILWLPN